ncbi:MAG TPA: FtsX-like permease family protein [Gaiellales bacterium]|nr:FtsX-like permease family protein [Gaiellales bacterium]
MRTLFGIPMGILAVVLVAMLAAALASVAVVAVRNRVFLRLGIRNAERRPGRSALIIVGLMLGTAIIAAALATGDTMTQTIRSSAVSALGQTDELVSARGATANVEAQSGAATGVRYFPQADYAAVKRAVAGSDLVDGVAPAIIEPVAAQNPAARRNEPQVTLFASDGAALRGFGAITALDGRAVSLSALAPGWIYLNRDGADKLGASAGDTLRVFAGRSAAEVRVKAVVSFDGAGSDGAAVLMPLAAAQELLGQPGRIKYVLVSNHGGATSGVAATGRVIALLRPAVEPLGLQTNPTKRDALDTADAMGAAFVSLFTTFGSFSIAAGILLIFLIFIMLAAERRGELGIARAVGTRQRNLVQMFLFEGVAYDLLAAAVGALVGIAVAYAMVLIMAGAFAGTSAFHVSYSVTPRTMVVAYSLGVLLTFIVVGASAWRVSRMNIVTAIRNLPEPPAQRGRRRHWLIGTVVLILGALLIASGVSARNAITLGFGVSLVLLGLVPVSERLGVRERVARTAAGLGLVVWFVLPIDQWILGDLSTDFSIFILGGLMIVVGASWTIMYNADLLLGGLSWSLGRFRGLAPVLRMSMAYPLRNRFRTGVTLAMFTLVVFTMVVGATTTTSFVNGLNDMHTYGGGFDVRATVSPTGSIPNMPAALRTAHGIDASGVRVVSAQSFLPVKAHQDGSPGRAEDYVVRGLDPAFLTHTTYGLAARANGYGSDAAVWDALNRRQGLAVIDASVVKRRSNFNFGAPQAFQLRGFYLEDKHFTPVPVDVRDPQTGAHVRLTVIGVLSETAPLEMAGIATSQATLSAAFPDRAQPTVYLFSLRPGVDAGRFAKQLESAFLANGMQADALSALLADAVSGSLTFDRLIMGFMGLGLIVGVTALGVITARSVVERRQQIGVLRAIGYRRRMVQTSFLLESSFIALTSIVLGTALGLAVSFNVIHNSQRQPSWENLSFDPPWLLMGLIFVLVYAVALGTTYLPAVRAAKVYPAEALRYQ